nr:hypothetical protein [Tanacetum cinerariifolium]
MFMALGGSDRNAEDALSKLLQRGTVAEYQNGFEMIINQITRKSKNLLASIYIFGLKPAVILALLWSNPITLGQALSLARIVKARYEDERATTTIAKPNDHNIMVSVQDIEETTLHKSNKVEETDLTSPDMVVAEDLGQKHIHDFDETEKDDEPGEVAMDVGDDGFKWGVHKASAFEELKERISTMSLPNFNKVFIGPRLSLPATHKKEIVTELPEEFQEGQSLENPKAICDSRVVFFTTAMQRRLWDLRIKIAFKDITLRKRWW